MSFHIGTSHVERSVEINMLACCPEPDPECCHNIGQNEMGSNQEFGYNIGVKMKVRL
jgi:hypothetical protein